MSLLVIGLNHTTAAIEMRERVAFSPEQIPEALLRALDGTGLAEAVILSTCNRTELIAATPAGGDGEECALDWFSTVHHLSRAQLDGSLYRHRDAEAMRHLIRVASGLDSMVMGEPQIFGQLKSAYSAARHAGTVGAELSRAVSHVFAVAKKVRTETAIGENPVSVAFAAVKLARHIFSDLAATTALLIGAVCGRGDPARGDSRQPGARRHSHQLDGEPVADSRQRHRRAGHARAPPQAHLHG